MQYDDTARRYNFLAGLGIGAALGVALAALALPRKRVLKRRYDEVRKGRRGGTRGRAGSDRFGRRSFGSADASTQSRSG